MRNLWGRWYTTMYLSNKWKDGNFSGKRCPNQTIVSTCLLFSNSAKITIRHSIVVNLICDEVTVFQWSKMQFQHFFLISHEFDDGHWSTGKLSLVSDFASSYVQSIDVCAKYRCIQPVAKFMELATLNSFYLALNKRKRHKTNLGFIYL